MRTIATSPDGHLLLNGRVLYLRGALDQDYYPDLIYTAVQRRGARRPVRQGQAHGPQLSAHPHQDHRPALLRRRRPGRPADLDRATELAGPDRGRQAPRPRDAGRHGRARLEPSLDRHLDHRQRELGRGPGGERRAPRLAGRYVQPPQGASIRTAWWSATRPASPISTSSPTSRTSTTTTRCRTTTGSGRTGCRPSPAGPPWTFAHVYESIESWREYIRDPWNPLPRQPAPEVRRRGNEPMVVSEFGNWGLPDVGQAQGALRRGAVVVRDRHRVGRRRGVPPRHRAALQGLPPGQGLPHPLGPRRRPASGCSSPRSSTRSSRCGGIPASSGYVITEFTDVHWECNGLLDMCRNPKAYYDVIGQVNSADAIVPIDWERIAFWEGERCEVQAGALALLVRRSARTAGSSGTWTSGPRSGAASSGIRPERAQLTNVGTVVFDGAPAGAGDPSPAGAAAPQRRRASWSRRNHHELYFFPAPRRRRGAASKLAAPGLPRLSARLGRDGLRDDRRRVGGPGGGRDA